MLSDRCMVTALLFLIYASAANADFDRGNEAYQRGEFITAFKEWTLAAEEGDAQAQHGLGNIYEYGSGVPKDYSMALEWYKAAAEKAFAPAEYRLGRLYKFHLTDDPDNLAVAASWYRKAAAQGHAEAQLALAAMYFKGEGVPKDETEAWMLASDAADQGLADAQELLGYFYTDPLFGEPDYVEAERLFRLADTGLSNQSLAELYEDGREVPRDYSVALDFYIKAAGKDNKSVYGKIGDYYAEGKGVDQDLAKALEWYERAAADNIGIGLRRLAVAYLNGASVEKDVKLAKELAGRAVDLGDVEGYFAYAMAIIDPHSDQPQNVGVADRLVAMTSLKHAAENNFPPSQLFLGVLYLGGQYIQKDPIEAYYWLERSSRHPNFVLHPTWKQDWAQMQLVAAALRDVVSKEISAETIQAVKERARMPIKK